jgi:hypothetical protein
MTYELIMVNRYGDVEANVYSSLRDVADKILVDIAEAVAEDLVLDLPEDAALFKATLISISEDGLYYEAIEQHGRWQVRHVIPASKAEYYSTCEEVFSSDGGSELHVIGRAIRIRGIIYYEVSPRMTQAKELEAELKAMLGEHP